MPFHTYTFKLMSKIIANIPNLIVSEIQPTQDFSTTCSPTQPPERQPAIKGYRVKTTAKQWRQTIIQECSLNYCLNSHSIAIADKHGTININHCTFQRIGFNCMISSAMSSSLLYVLMTELILKATCKN